MQIKARFNALRRKYAWLAAVISALSAGFLLFLKVGEAIQSSQAFHDAFSWLPKDLKMPTIHPAWFVPLLGFAAAAVVYFYGRKQYMKSLPSVVLDHESDLKSFWVAYWKVVVRNNHGQPIQNVRVEILKTQQFPSYVHDFNLLHPVLYAEDSRNGTINPNASVPFDFFYVETTGGKRTFTFQGRSGLEVFECGLNELMRGYTVTFTIQVSCLEFTPVVYAIELKMKMVSPFDSGSAPFPNGFDISISKEK